MKLIYICLMIVLLKVVNAGVTRKQPQYAKPVYSNSYLPAAMQVIFYAVDQIRSFPPEEGELGPSTTLPTTTPHAPGQHQPAPTPNPPVQQLMQTDKPLEKPPQEAIIAELSPVITSSTPASDLKPELSEETPEAVYGTPETNHETPEASQEVQESNQEVPVTKNPQGNSTVSSDELTSSPAPTTAASSEESSEESIEEKKKENKGKDKEKKEKEPSIDSVVQEIYGIVKKNKSKDSLEESDESRESSEGKSNDESSGENEGEEYDEDRFTMLGEKVVQVPRPSLLAYLKRARITLRCSLEQLAVLYDALSKDARRQGFVKFSGYTDEVLGTLETSGEGGIGPQLQRLLEKIVERKEATRDDTKVKITETLKNLKEPGSSLNRDLRRLLPLKFKI